MTKKAEGFNLKARIRAFSIEWEKREAMMKLGGFEKEAIALHRREILHMYSLTEEDLNPAP